MPRLRKPVHRRIERETRPRLIADRRVILHGRGRVSHIRVPAVAQVAAVLLLIAGAGWFVHASYSYIANHDIVSTKNAAIAAREQANYTLRRELDAARRQFAEVTASLEKDHEGLVSLIDENGVLETSINELRDELGRMKEERDTAENDRLRLMRQLAAMETRVQRAKARNQQLSSQLQETGVRLAEALSDHDRADQREMTLSERVRNLQGRLSNLRESQTALLDRLTDTTKQEIGRLQEIVASTGLDIGDLVSGDDSTGVSVAEEAADGDSATHQGGPFEPAGAGGEVAGVRETAVALADAYGLLDRLDGLQQAMRTLPLAAPLDTYYISSPYGRRKDPINGEAAMHRGLDFGSKYRAHVYATAPGKVSYAGWKGRYGRFVEIDHGNGLVTRFGHLRRIDVKRGETVEHRTKLGEMGSSGRSTGAHLHYEILLNGKSVDPLKFLKAGKNVFKG